MIETSARLLQLLSLLQTRKEWSGPKLAEHLDVTERTIRRDMDKLRTLGYPISASPGVAGGYQLGSGARLPPLLLDDEEAIAVALALSSISASPVKGVGEAALRALTKLEQVLPSRLRPKFANMRKSVQRTRGPVSAVDPRVLTTLSTAISERHVVHYRYRRMDGQTSTRQVEPYGLVDTGLRWYLVAFDKVRQDWRIFRADRFTSIPETRAKFVPRTLPHPDLTNYVETSVTDSPYRALAVVRFQAGAVHVRERIPANVGIVKNDGETSVLRAGFDHVPYIMSVIIGADVDFEILEPPELKDYARVLLRRLA